MTSGNLQKIDIKIPLSGADGRNFDVLLEIFGRWRGEEGEEIMDLADYLHVPSGPGCLLISHRWHFGIDFEDGQAGIFFSNRSGLEGELDGRIRAVLGLALTKARRLLDEPSLEGLQLDLSTLEVTVNDRAKYPNEDQADQVFRPALITVMDTALGSGAFKIERDLDPGSRLGYRILCTENAPTLEELAQRLAVC